ncbi:MAG: FeoA domain-containing protein, partial [Bacteroidales bacterium]|nr:FeoA domain-containing protein [Bacteroidales bacterium]
MDNNEKRISLNEMLPGAKCVIIKISGHGGLRHRLMEMGFVKGETVTVLKSSPLQDPVEYIVMNSHVSLRRSEAEKIEVLPLSEQLKDIANEYNGTIEEAINDADLSAKIQEKSHTLTVALVGNPNCGKTSFFNHATGLHEKVGNYSGVTVDMKIGIFYYKGYTIRLVDLPGTYSLNEYTPEELCVREFLTKNDYDLILNIVDSSNLERNLFLTTQLIDMSAPMVMAWTTITNSSTASTRFSARPVRRVGTAVRATSSTSPTAALTRVHRTRLRTTGSRT